MRRTSLFVLTVTLVLGGCSHDSSPGDPDGGGEPDAELTPDAGLPETATATIGNAGGAIAIAGLTITFAPGAVAADTAITVTRTADAPPSGSTANSLVFEFLPTGLTFAATVTVAVDVTGDTSASALQWTSDGSTWDPIAGTETSGIFTATVGHFTGGFVGFIPFPSGMVTWDPPGGFTGAEVFALVETATGTFDVGNFGEIYAIDAPFFGADAVTMALASDLAAGGGTFLRGATGKGAGFVASGMVGSELGAVMFDAAGELVRAVGVDLQRPDLTNITSEGKGAAALDDGTIAVVGFQGATLHVVYLDGGLTTVPVALELDASYGKAIAPGVGGGVVVGSTYGVFRIDEVGGVTWQKTASGLSGSIVKIVRFGDRYAVVGNWGSPAAPYILLLDDTGAVLWQRRLESTATGVAVAAGASSIEVLGTSYVWIGGAVGAGAYEWILDGDGELVHGGGYGSGRAISATSSVFGDMLVAGITPTGVMWATRHGAHYDLPGSCGTSTTAAAATPSLLAFGDLTPALVPRPLTVPAGGLHVAAITPTHPASPAHADGCP